MEEREARLARVIVGAVAVAIWAGCIVYLAREGVRVMRRFGDTAEAEMTAAGDRFRESVVLGRLEQDLGGG